ncbi:MAG: cytochrome c [Thermoanaerobaculia bacterium]|nr:cytochrome c [Thermoanaerobaculia bacterium]
MKKVIVVAVSLAFGAAAAFAGGSPDPTPTFKAKCAMCHGADGKKENKAMGIKPLTSPEVQKKTDKELIDITTGGKGKMPAYKGKLSEVEIQGLVEHIRSLAK